MYNCKVLNYVGCCYKKYSVWNIFTFFTHRLQKFLKAWTEKKVMTIFNLCLMLWCASPFLHISKCWISWNSRYRNRACGKCGSLKGNYKETTRKLLLTIRKTRSKSDVVLSTNIENKMDRACEIWWSLKENRDYKETAANDQKGIYIYKREGLTSYHSSLFIQSSKNNKT